MNALRSVLADALSRAAAAPGSRVLVSGCGFHVTASRDGSVRSDLEVPSVLANAGAFRVAAVRGPGLRIAAERLEQALGGEARLLRDLGLAPLSLADPGADPDG